MTRSELARLIDHTLLKPDATEQDIRRLCQEAAEYGFASVCVHPVFVPLAAAILSGTEIRVGTVVGFPLGANFPEAKAYEARLAVERGAVEIDMVMNIGALKGGDHRRVVEDIRAVVESAGELRRPP